MSVLASCPPSAELEQFLLGRLGGEGSQAVESHVCECIACQALISNLAAEDDFVRALKMRPDGCRRESPSAQLNAAPDDLVNLLVPHFKRISASFDVVEDSVKNGVSSRRSPAEETTLVPPAMEFPGLADVDGTNLGRYQVCGVLGSGGMGTVLHGYDPILQRSVAIKVVNSRFVAEPEMTERLVREAQAAAAVEHDNIVAIHAVEVIDGVTCIIMPLLKGMTLRERLEESDRLLPVSEIQRIARETAAGLAAAHERGLVHCDMKPANLWLEAPGGRVKILDFGLAIVRDQQKGDSEGISGTPGYLAPEQARGFPVDQRTDVFSFGCVLYRMATGRQPFAGDRHLRALWTVLSNPPPSAIGLNQKLSQEFSDLIDSMLAREPVSRPASATAVLERLDAIEDRLLKQRARMARRRWLAGLAGATILSASSVGWWSWMMAPPVVQPVHVQFLSDDSSIPVVLRHEGQEQTFRLGGATSLSLLPGDYLIRTAANVPNRSLSPDRFTVLPEAAQSIRIALIGEVARHQVHAGLVMEVAVVPNSSPPVVLSVGKDRALVKWETAGPSETFANLPHSAFCLAVSPDGRTVITGGGNRTAPTELALRIWDVNSLASRGELNQAHSRIVTALDYSPDGKTVASAGMDGVFLWNLQTGQAQLMEQGAPRAIYAMVFSPDGQRLLTADEEGQVILWDMRTNRPVQTRSAGNSVIRTVALLPDAIFAAGNDRTIRIWNALSFEPRELSGHAAAVNCLAVSPDGRQLLSGDDAGTILVWSLPGGQIIAVLKGHIGAVKSLALTSDGRQAVSGGADRTVRLWQLPFP